MAQTVAQHSVASFTSPVNGTSPIDANQVRGNDNTLRGGYNDHDADTGIHLQSSAVAARPAAGDLGRKWLTTDTGAVRLYFDTGSAWAEVSYLPLAGGTVAGNVSITGTLAVTSAITATGGVVGNVTGNASTATALATARTINGVSFDGTANITVTADAGTLTGSTLASGVTASSLTSVGTLANLTVTNPITGSVTGSSGSTTGNAATATALQTARTINGTSFDGTANITVTAAAGTLTGTTLNSTVVSSSLTSVGTLTAGEIGSGFTAIANSALANSSVTVNGTAIALGASGTVTAAAGTLTGSTLASGVTASSLTSVGTLTSLAVSGTTALNGQTYTWPSGGGTNGQVLTTNGSGTLSWTTVSGGGGGTTTNSLTAGSYLTGGSFNGSAAVTFAVDATDANTASKVVARDGSGNFSAGTITAALSGNASTATTLATARNINGVSFNGSADITVADATKLPLTGGTLTGVLTGATNVGNIVPFYFADQTAFPSATTYHGAIAHSHADGKMFQAHGGAWNALANESGNVATATALQTARNINGVSFNGTANITVTADASTLTSATLASGVTASSLTSVGTLTSLAVTGDLTVDTSTLKVDSTNNRVGIVTASPSHPLHVVGTSYLQQVIERATVSATAATGTINYDALTQAVLFYTSNASANWTLNLRGSSTVSMNTLLAVGDSLTVTFLVQQGTTAYYPTAHQIDGSSVTPKWQGGTAPTAGNASSIDIYTYTIIKTAATPTYTLLASQTKFA